MKAVALHGHGLSMQHRGHGSTSTSQCSISGSVWCIMVPAQPLFMVGTVLIGAFSTSTESTSTSAFFLSFRVFSFSGTSTSPALKNYKKAHYY